MMRRTPTRRAGANSPPAAGAASGHNTGKSDIAPVATAPEFRTPGRLKSARKAPWRSPGAALRPGDENALGHRPKSAAKSAGKPHARKLDARSPATAASAKTRAGKPKFTPANQGPDADADAPAPAVEPPSNPASSPPRDPAPRSPMATVTNTSHTPGGVLAAVNTILLTPPSTGPKTRSVGDAAGTDAEEEIRDDARADADADAGADEAMPPPPARTPATVASLHSHRAETETETETEDWGGETRTSDLDGMETMAIPAVAGWRADDVPAPEDAAPVPEAEEVPENTALVPENTAPVPDASMAVASPLGSKTPAAPALGSPFSAPASSPALSLFTPGLPGGVAHLTPLAAARVPEDDTAAVNAMRLPTPTMDLTPLGRGVPTETVPFPVPAFAPRPGTGATAPGATRGAFEDDFAETEDDFDLDDGELSAEAAKAAEAMTEGARATAPSAAPSAAPPAAPPAAPSAAPSAPSVPPAAPFGAAPPAKTPGKTPGRTPSAGIPPRATTPSTQQRTPQWARNQRAWHEQRQAQMEEMMAQARALSEAQARQSAAEASEVKLQQEELAARMAEQQAQLAAQREALEAQRWEMQQAAEAAAAERERMREELKAQIDAQERTRRRLSEMAAAAAAAARATDTRAAPAVPSVATSSAAAAAAAAAAMPPPPPKVNLAPLEEELRACRRAIESRAAESEALSKRAAALQQEEADLHLRAAEIQRRMLRAVMEHDPSAATVPTVPTVPTRSGAPPYPSATAEAVRAVAAAADRFENPSLGEPGSFAAAFGSGSTMDDDGFIVMDYSGCAKVAAATPIAAENVRAPSLGLGPGPGGVSEAGRGPVASDGSAPAAPAPAADASAPREVTTSDVAPTGSIVAADDANDGVAPASACRAVAARRGPAQTIELRKEVVAAQFLGAGSSADAPGMLMTATVDGCVRLFAPGARRASAMIRGPREGLSAAAAAGAEAFVAAAGAGGHVARFDLASGRELGVLLASSAAVAGDVGAYDAVPRELSCVTAGAVGSGLVAAAGEGGDVHLWDVRVAPRGSRKSLGAKSYASGGVAPVLTLRVSGAARVLSLSLPRGANPDELAVVASNGARVFDLRAPERPSRLTSREPGARWIAAAHAATGETLTLAASGDVHAWYRRGSGYDTARVLREMATPAARGARPVLATSWGCGDAGAVDDAPAFALCAGGDRGEGARVWDARSGDVVAEYGAGGDLEGGFEGAWGMGYGIGIGAGGAAAAAPRGITAACWGTGDAAAPFGSTSFAVANAEGIVRVYGPSAEA